MNLRQMEVFRAVVHAGGVAGAAALLHVSQPAVSKVLAQAARQAGFALFERIRGRLVLTPEGEQLYQEIDALWRGVERVRDVSRHLADPRTGSLRVGVSASLATHLAPRAVALMYERFPHLKTHMEVLISPLMESTLLSRSIDLGVALQAHPHPNLVAISSYRCDLVCAMHEDHPLARRELVRIADLRGERLVTSSADTPYGQTLARVWGRQAATLRLDLDVRSSTMACWYAQARAGIAVVDRAAVAGQTFAGLAIRRLQTRERLGITVLRNRDRPLSTADRAFCEAFETAWRESMA
ncbi:MAG: LysR family transcriptional regulator [Burkholderiaceae bacterium]|nr:LysR family transcriptional regulator [Burkholderiaceae bacterium]